MRFDETAFRRALSLLYVVELGLLLAALGVRQGAFDTEAHVSMPLIALTMLGIAIVPVGLAFLALTLRHSASRVRTTGAVLGLNAFTLVAVALLAEAMLRAIAEPASPGIAIGRLKLPPTWPEVRERNRVLIARATRSGHWADSYLIPHPVLGWTVGPSRSWRDGAFTTYASSDEGIRSAVPGSHFGSPNGRRVLAIVGDSYAFSLRVPYEHSLGAALQSRLGDDWLVLNFGVDGYGVDQAVLRYREHVRRWKPDVVLFGVSNHDLLRTMAVYAYVSFPEWEMPFAKPRFVVDGAGLRLINVPLPDPEESLGAGDVRQLPWIAHDYGYARSDWNSRDPGLPLLVRWTRARFPAFRKPASVASNATMLEVNARVLRAGWNLADAAGTRPMQVLFPTRGAGDFDARLKGETWARRALRMTGHPFTDLTPCLRAVPAEFRLAADDRHYSARSNAAAADCLLPELNALAR